MRVLHGEPTRQLGEFVQYEFPILVVLYTNLFKLYTYWQPAY